MNSKTEIRFLVVSDIHDNIQNVRKLVDWYQKEKPKIEIENNNKANIRKRFLKQISKKIQPLSSPKNTQLKMKRSSYFELLQSKQIFQKFLCIGIDESGLETIEDMDELMLMPKITFNFPNNKSENELEL